MRRGRWRKERMDEKGRKNGGEKIKWEKRGLSRLIFRQRGRDR
jgi:hypothetical protein